MRRISNIKLITLTLIVSIFIGLVVMPDALAAKKKKKMSDEEITMITDTVNDLMKKVYSAALFSPKDNEKLIEIKLQLDEAMDSSPNNKDFPQLFFKTGFIYKERERRDEAIECFQVILDNFPDSSYAVKAVSELKKMGVKIKSPDEESDSE